MVLSEHAYLMTDLDDYLSNDATFGASNPVVFEKIELKNVHHRGVHIPCPFP